MTETDTGQTTETMLRKVFFVQPELYERAMEYVAKQVARGSAMRLPELVRLALHEYLERHKREG